MSTLLITTPGMGKTSLVKELKRSGRFACDFDVAGTKPRDPINRELVTRANTAWVNHTFQAGYEVITTFPGFVDYCELDPDIRVIFIVPVGDAMIGCQLRIAGREPGTKFALDAQSSYHDWIDSIESDYVDACSMLQTAPAKYVVGKASTTLSDIFALIEDGYEQPSSEKFLDVKPKFTSEAIVGTMLERSQRDLAYHVLTKHLTPEIVSDLCRLIDSWDGSCRIHGTVVGYRHFDAAHIVELCDSLSSNQQIHRITNTCGPCYSIEVLTLEESDEMMDCYHVDHFFLKEAGV